MQIDQGFNVGFFELFQASFEFDQATLREGLVDSWNIVKDPIANRDCLGYAKGMLEAIKGKSRLRTALNLRRFMSLTSCCVNQLSSDQ